VAIATVLFPTLARYANAKEFVNLRATLANGMRQILFVLLPATALILALSTPIIRIVYQRGHFDPADTKIVSTALFWFAFSLPTNGVYLLQTRTFFSLQRPWQATGLAVIDLVVSAAAAAVLYKPFGIGGIVAGTGIGTSAAVFAQAYILRRKFGGLELGRLLSTVIRISIACAAMAAVSWVIWDVLNTALGEDTPAQIISLGTGMTIGGVVYLAVAKALRIAEFEQIMRLLLRRRRA
jgi:putative peptidoglycan lipid II flippase